MKKQLSILFSLILFTTIIYSQIQVAEDAQMPRISGVDVCELFTLEELRQLTGLDLTIKQDRSFNVPGYIYGNEFYPENFGYNPSLGPKVEGRLDVPWNGRRCYFRTDTDSDEWVLISFFAYESRQEVLNTYATEEPFYHRAGLMEIGNHCVVNPATMSVWINVQVVSNYLSAEEKSDLSCKIVIDGALGLRALAVRDELMSR